MVDLARVEPSLISAAALLVPASIHPDFFSHRFFYDLVTGVVLPMKAYRMVPCSLTKYWVCANLFDEPDVEHHSMTHQQLAYRHILWYPPPARVAKSKEEFEDYGAPTFVVSATKDIFGGGEATAVKSKELFGEDTEVEVVDGAHVLGKAKMDQIMRQVAEFFIKKGFPGRVI